MPAPAVLVVFPWCLERIGHGNIQRVLTMASYLSRHGVVVDLVYQGNPRVPSREHELAGFRRIIRVTSLDSSDDARLHAAREAFYGDHELPSWNLSPGTALTAVVRSLVDAVDYTAVISSYAWTAPIFDGLAHRTLRIVDVHDVLSLHTTRCEQATGRTSPFSMPAGTERFLWQQWDVLLAITPEEAAVIKPALQPTQQLLTVRHAVPAVDWREPASDTVIYAGSDNHSNQAAVTWLLSEVWPQVLAVRPQAQLRVVGLICDPMRKTTLGSTPNVEWRGFVERPSDELTDAAICVAPYLYGSGLKIKVIEAAGSGRPIVTTTAGADGSGLEPGTHVLVEDDAAAFAGAIVRLIDDRRLRVELASAAHAHVQRTFSEDACYGALLDQIRRRAAMVGEPAIISATVEERLRTTLGLLTPASVVVWGNGSHTRSLMPVLRRLDAPVRCIVDNALEAATVSAERCPVVPGRTFEPASDELIVLSSQMYEPDMWNDLARARASGAHVLGLYRRDLTTDALKLLLSSAVAPGSLPSSRHPVRDAAYYQNIHERSAKYRSNNWLVDEIDNVGAFNASTILEIACGNGQFLECASTRFAQVYGCDWAVSPVLERVLASHANVTFFRTDLYRATPPCRPDLVVSADFLEHIAPDSLVDVLRRIDALSSMAFHKIACYDDGHSHLSVLEPGAWLGVFRSVDPAYRLVRIEARAGNTRQPIAVVVKGTAA